MGLRRAMIVQVLISINWQPGKDRPTDRIIGGIIIVVRINPQPVVFHKYTRWCIIAREPSSREANLYTFYSAGHSC